MEKSRFINTTSQAVVEFRINTKLVRTLFWNEPGYALELGIKGKTHIKNNFLMTRQINDYLLAFLSLIQKDGIVCL